MDLSFHTPSFIWIILAAVALVVFVVWTYRQVMTQLARRTGWLMTGLRIGAVGTLLVMLCEPAASIVLRHAEPASLLLLVDTSASMGLSDRTGHRTDIVSRLLTEGWLDALQARYTVHPYRFDETVTPLSPDALDSLPVQPHATDIGGALEFAATRIYTAQIAGVVLVTDGNYTVGLDPERVAARLNAPIYAVGVGDTLETRDVAVVRHLTNEVAYVESKVPVEVTLRSQGLERASVPVTLTEGDRVIATETVTLSGAGREQPVLFHIVPTAEGVHRYTVSIPAQSGELVSQNNRYGFSIKVLKNKMRILYIEGAPRPDLTFLKQTFERDPNVEVTRIMARPAGGFYPDPMPNTREDWFGYDLIVLGSIPASKLQPWMRLIVSFVEQKGGGLVVLGGPESFDLGGYGGTPLGDLMPVHVSPQARGLVEGLFLPELTPDGRTHPLMQLDEDPVASLRIWSGLPPLPGINQVGPAKPGATVLAVHPTWQVDGRNAPVIAIQQYGLGRVMTIAGYDLWRWDLMMWGAGQTNAGYERFWSNAVRWLTMRENSRRVRVTPVKPEYRSGETVELTGQVYDKTYQPVDDAVVSVHIASKTDEQQQITVELRPVTNGSGLYRGTVRNLGSGDYTFVARASRRGQPLGTETGGFTVGEPAIEYDQTTLNQELLGRLAAVTGGRFYRAVDAGRLLKDIKASETVVTRTNEIQLWNHPAPLIVFILLLTGEWLLRRRHGLM